MKKGLLAILLSIASISAVHAEMKVEGNVGVTSDYRFRGISQTQTNPTLQGGVDYSDTSGFYLGNWNSGVSKDLYVDSKGVESDFYGGYRKSFGAVSVEAGLMRYNYWGADTFDTTEFNVGAGLGPVSVKVNRSMTDYFGTADSKGTMYYDLTVAQPVGRFTVSAHAGYTDVANQSTNDYADYSVGVSTDVAGFAVGAKWYTNNMKDAYKTANTVNGKALYKDGFVFTVSKAF